MIDPSVFELEFRSTVRNVCCDVLCCSKSSLCKLVPFQCQQGSKLYVTPKSCHGLTSIGGVIAGALSRQGSSMYWLVMTEQHQYQLSEWLVTRLRCNVCDVVDVTTYHRGFHGDLNETMLVGSVSDKAKLLVETTHECLARAIAAGSVVVLSRLIDATPVSYLVFFSITLATACL